MQVVSKIFVAVATDDTMKKMTRSRSSATGPRTLSIDDLNGEQYTAPNILWRTGGAGGPSFSDCVQEQRLREGWRRGCEVGYCSLSPDILGAHHETIFYFGGAFFLRQNCLHWGSF